ncbi:hypothetical protein FB451DRAFT_1401110 [Mycena latifolia]|nr:hypothetical protein FB451DRAFT_1401110 [Mycena latifolia]
MGYVDTTTSASVLPYIDAYAAWDSSYRPAGILLDHVSATASLVDTYQAYVAHARSKGFTFVSRLVTSLPTNGNNVASTYGNVLVTLLRLVTSLPTNGNNVASTLPLSELYQSAYGNVLVTLLRFVGRLVTSLIRESFLFFDDGSPRIMYRLPWTRRLQQTPPFDAASLAGDASTPLSKQSVVLTNAPANGSYGTVISQLASLGVAAVYITEAGSTDSALPSHWSAFVAEVAKTGSSSSSAGSSSLASTASSASPSKVVKIFIVIIAVLNLNQPGIPKSRTKTPLAAILGGVLGGVVFLLGVLIIFMCIRRRSRSPPAPEFLHSEPPAVVAPFVAQNGEMRSANVKGRPAVPSIAPMYPESQSAPTDPPPSYSVTGASY